MIERVLVLAPHTDDAELGCGGTIAKLSEAGASVHILTFSDARKSLPAGVVQDATRREQRKAAALLGATVEILNFETRTFPAHRQEILEALIERRGTFKPDLVLMPALHDQHQDHATVAAEGWRAFRRSARLLGYEIPNDCPAFIAQAHIALSPVHIKAKLGAVACYASQNGRRYMNAECVNARALLRGLEIGADYAEAFEVYQWIL
jgi:LmbE family N-acetylglucosaminyl deacetylase